MTADLLTDRTLLRQKFYDLTTPRDVAALLGVEYPVLIYHLYKVPPSEQYATFSVRKRSGGTRVISSPATTLKIIQQKLNHVLQQVYIPKAPAHAFVKGKSIVTNAAMHTRKKHVLNLDLKGFFPSITFRRVRGLFEAIPYERNRSVAMILARICCHQNRLPQGAPTSPAISNMICAKMDSRLRRLAVKYRCVYTRYADDITFSTSLPNFPEALASVVSTETGTRVVIGPELQALIESNGFEVNHKKVRLQTADRRQIVTGLVVNRYPNVRKKYIKEVRAMLHEWQTRGLENAERDFHMNYDHRNRSPVKDNVSFAQVVKGKIEFLGMVRGKKDAKYLSFLLQLARLAPEMVNLSTLQIEREQDRNNKLIEILRGKFSIEDLRDLCYYLGVDYEELGSDKSALSRELVRYMNHRDQIDQLEERIRELRPKVFSDS